MMSPVSRTIAQGVNHRQRRADSTFRRDSALRPAARRARISRYRSSASRCWPSLFGVTTMDARHASAGAEHMRAQFCARRAIDRSWHAGRGSARTCASKASRSLPSAAAANSSRQPDSAICESFNASRSRFMIARTRQIEVELEAKSRGLRCQLIQQGAPTRPGPMTPIEMRAGDR